LPGENNRFNTIILTSDFPSLDVSFTYSEIKSLYIRPDQWIINFNNYINYTPNRNYFMDIGDGLYGDVDEEDYWDFN
jgi:hypothetical protein